ncbi:hypothetical protein ABZ667_36475 [Streptomyces lavendulae]|uniref:hypothetical protein n=1 Tax=Streptomyces lavendulae TaxID=1914 RepID=UPI0033DF772A
MRADGHRTTPADHETPANNLSGLSRSAVEGKFVRAQRDSRAAVDGSIGKVDKHSDEVGDAYLVVDTGVWIFGKEVLLPVGTVISIDPEQRTIHVERTREQIKDSPEFHRDKHLGDAVYREQLGLYYGPAGPFGGPFA